jgi:hypothetical protein
MPQGDKSKYTSKQKRQAKHIEDSEKESGKSTKRSEQIAYATINKQDGGGKKAGGSGSTRKSTKKASGGMSHAAHVAAGKKAARTRASHANR